MNSRNIIVFVGVLAVVLIGSIVLGTAIGTEDFKTIAGFLLITLAISAFLLLGRSVWVLVPIFSIWSGTVPLLPLPFSVANITLAFAVGCWLLLLFTRRVHWRYRLDTLDIWLMALFAILVVGYITNPIGVAALANNTNVGARPYFEVGMAFIGYVMLANQDASVKVVSRLPIVTVLAALVIAVGGAVAFFVPQAGLYMYMVYSGFMPNMSEVRGDTEVNQFGIGRAEYLLPFAHALSTYLFAGKPPLVSLSPLKPLRLMGVAISGILILLSGFRNAVGAMGFHFIIGTFLWWRGRGLLFCLVASLLGIGTIAAVQSMFNLPERVQRPLSFLPGDWSPNVRRSAEESTQWRLDMWEEVIQGDSVKNWWIGDGFGFPAADLNYYGYLQREGKISPEQMADYYLMTGDLHSGPLSSLKFVGVIGFLAFLGLSLGVAWRFIRLWRRNREPALRLPIAFFGITSIYFPIKFVAIFGAFQRDLPYVIVAAGILRLLENCVKNNPVPAPVDESEPILTKPSPLKGKLRRPARLAGL